MYKIIKLFFLLSFVFVSGIALAGQAEFNHFYVGMSYGHGNTNWDQVTVSDPASLATETTPIRSESAGPVKGLFFGYYIVPNFAVEARYHQYAPSYIHFDPVTSIYAGTNKQDFVSRTHSYSLVGKFIVPIFSVFNVYAVAGAAKTYRDDVFASHRSNLGATFGMGVNYYIGNHVLTSLEGDYTTGYGKAETLPVNDYVPFLYNIDVRVAYRF